MNNAPLLPLRSKLKPFSGRPDLTPLVDVLFLLLIFFMLSSSFVQVSGVKVDLPRAGSNSSVGIEKFIVTVTQSENGTLIYFNDKPITLETLSQELASMRAISNMNTVIIRADERVEYGKVAQIMALAEKANLSAFLATIPLAEQQETIFDRNEQR